MRMLVRVPFVIVAFSAMWYIALAKSRFGGPTTVAPERRWMIETTTTGSPGQNLEGKMFTLSRNSGGIAFYSPYFMPSTTQPYPTTSTGTTAPTVTGVSVCLRYLTDPGSIPSFFRLGSASSYSLYLDLQDTYNYKLGLNYGHTLTFQPNKMFGAPPAMPWTSLCLTVDNKKKVAQVFSGSKMSIRKLMPGQMVWSGEPVIEFSSFNGQLTDVQVWDYPISYPDVLSYIYRDFYWTQRGSVITWSSINYSLRGNALLEDSFEKQRSEVGRKRTQKKFLRAQKRQGGKKRQL